MKNVLVEKRDGNKEEYDVTKTKYSIALAVEGTGANALELESTLDQFIKSGIRTKDIQKNVIQHAVQLASAYNPEWLSVAGRAFAMDEWASYKLKGKNLGQVIRYCIKKGEYTADLLDYYTDADFDELNKHLKFEYDLDHTYASLITARKKYLNKFELNQHMHMVNAMRFGQFEPKETRNKFVVETYKILAERKLSLATPFMSNLRKGGNIASCFILAISDDLDSIFGNIHRIAKISKNGGGLGVYLGMIRAKGSSVNGHENAAGSIVAWIKIINDTLVAVNQGGLRLGAGTVALPIWHNDIFDFLDMQTEHGDPRAKAYDVFPQIVIPDLFYKRDKANLPWTTFCPFEVKTKLGIEMYGLWGDKFEEAYAIIEEAAASGKLKVSRKVDSARTLTKVFMKTQFETGLPYICNVDEVNRQNPNKHDATEVVLKNGKSEIIPGFIPCYNLCTESNSNVLPDTYGHVCNLASINLGNIKDMNELARVSKFATKVLDYGISLTNAPDAITKAHNDRYRTIGIGIMGLHDYLARERYSYKHLDHIRELQECIQYNASLASVEQAKIYGSFEAFKGSDWNNGSRVERFKQHTSGKYDWDFLQAQINQFGMRNSQLTSPAPTTSTSIYQDASASFLPVFEAFFKDDNKNGSMTIAARFLKQNPIGYGKTLSKFDPKEIIDVTAELQKFIDTGCSMELQFDHNKENFKAKDLYDAIHYAFEKKVKSIYYIRSIKKNEVAQKAEADCVACAG